MKFIGGSFYQGYLFKTNKYLFKINVYKPPFYKDSEVTINGLINIDHHLFFKYIPHVHELIRFDYLLSDSKINNHIDRCIKLFVFS